jgi:fumarylacetoacetase
VGIEIAANSDFTFDNLPFGIFSCQGKKRVGVAIGTMIFDLTSAVDAGWFPEVPLRSMHTGFLNEFISLGKKVTNEVRRKLQEILQSEDHYATFLVDQKETTMHMPVEVGDYTDFYSSEEHATNVGKLYRDPENALMPNWKHIPVGYHGRSSSIVVSGTDVIRPKGQMKKTAEEMPSFGPSQALDFELELGFIVGKDTEVGNVISTDEAEEYIFGMVLLNDWSARDIQKWEYVPLGPFLGKNFATSISPWVVPYEALKYFKLAGPEQNPEVLDYLKYTGEKNLDIELSVSINGNVVSESNFKYMYWNMEQQLAHHTVNGCNVRVGDLMGSGTISGKDEKSYGSLLELSQGGKKSIKLSDGSLRTFLEDGDEVLMRGWCEKDGRRVGFGTLKGKILPSK